MAMTYGHLLMGKHKKADLKAIQDEARSQQKKAQKRGLWSSIGGTLGTLAVPLMFGTMGPMGAMAAKMAMGRIGRELGQHAAGDIDTSNIKGEHGFYGDIAKDYIAGIEDADKALDRQQNIQSIMNPLQEFGLGEASKMAGKWAGGTKLGKGYQEYVDKGGMFGKTLDKTGDYLSDYLPFLQQVPDHIDPETGEPGVSY